MSRFILGVLAGVVLAAAGTALYLKYPQLGRGQESDEQAPAEQAAESFGSKVQDTIHYEKEARRFARESGCDWLSVAVGNIHGAIAEGVRDLGRGPPHQGAPERAHAAGLQDLRHALAGERRLRRIADARRHRAGRALDDRLLELRVHLPQLARAAANAPRLIGLEQGQGVGYLDDGTMVVVEDGRRYIDRRIEVMVTRSAAPVKYLRMPTTSRSAAHYETGSGRLPRSGKSCRPPRRSAWLDSRVSH